MTQFKSLSELLDFRHWFFDVWQANPSDASPETDVRRVKPSIQAKELPRKTSRVKNKKTVPKTDTGGRGEKPKVNE